MKYTLLISWVVLGLLYSSANAQSYVEINGRRYILPSRRDNCPKPKPAVTPSITPPNIDVGGNLNTIMDLKDTIDSLKRQLAEKDASLQKISSQVDNLEEETPISPAIPLGAGGLGALLVALVRFVGFKNSIGL